MATKPVSPTAAHNEPTRTLLSPSTIKLPGAPTTIKQNQFAAVAGKKPLPTDAFTEREVMTVAKDKIFYQGGTAYVVTKTRHVPLHDYVKQLNDYETFLNQNGYTLRDGPFSKGKFTTQPNSDMGVILKLIDKPIENGGKGGPASWQREAPNAQHKVDFGEDRYFESHVFVMDPATKTNPVVDRRGGRVVVGDRNQRLGRRRVLLARDLMTGAPRYGSVAFVKPPVPSNPGQQTFGQQPSGQQPCGDEKAGICDLAICGNLNPLCPEGEDCRSEDEKQGATPMDKDKPSTGPCIPPKEASDPTCLYDGTIEKIEWAPLSICRGGTKGGWFGAEMCMDQFTSNDEAGGVLHLDNKGTATLKIMLFGNDFPILQASSESWYDGSQTQSNGFSLAPAKVVVPLAGNAEIDSNYSQNFEGPGATFLVGPVPITLSSGLYASMGKNNSAPNNQAPPLACNMSGTGQMEMNLGASANAGVLFQAKLDALVASAGVEAKLDLVDVNFTSKLFTTVNPNINEVKANPSLDFDGKMLKGHIDLFVEVDVLLYSKKWSVELFSFGGWDKSVSYPKQGVNLSKTLYAKKTSQNVSRSGGRKRNVTTAIL